jgi:hypothetical protein
VSPALLLRSVTVSPEHHGASIEERDYPVPLPVGGFWLSRTVLGSEVRAAVGELSHEGFSPVAVARVIDSEAEVAFDPLGIPADPELEAAARIAAGL